MWSLRFNDYFRFFKSKNYFITSVGGDNGVPSSDKGTGVITGKRFVTWITATAARLVVLIPNRVPFLPAM